ncbi:Lactose permease [Penicillium lagena]|uniref:Lactose permease n=1 Tax=Penicillium lagena TaxID=94218 RepID=UPI002541A1D5|nr:Lactose permease [Penicillium lagena]KAJ5606669.1 Lactose permease [Penicillium lagena]
MLKRSATGTWLPAWVPESTLTLSFLLLICSIVQSATGGYDGSMLNGLNILPSYNDYFNLNPVTTGLNTASVNIGGALGPLVSGVITDRLGRRPAIFWGSVGTIVGIILQTAAQNIAMFVVARIILGFGSAITGVAGGIYLSEVFPSRWRAWGPESPRWLVHQGHYEEARLSVAQTNANGNLSDPVVLAIFKEIVDTLKWEKEAGHNMNPMEIFKTPSARKRLLIGMSAGPFSCIAGNIIASYYFGKELDTAGITNSNDQLKANVVLDVWCLACCLIGTHLASKWGRKPTAMLSQALLSTCLFIIGGLSKMYASNPSGASSGLVYGNVAVMFLFQGFYSVAWTPLLYLYPPEIMNYSIRANGVAFSSFVLNAFALVFTFIMPIALGNIGWKMYMINASWDVVILGLIAYYWVETKGKTLEEIDALFEGEKHSSVPDVEKIQNGDKQIDTTIIEEQLTAELDPTRAKVSGSEVVS